MGASLSLSNSHNPPKMRVFLQVLGFLLVCTRILAFEMGTLAKTWENSQYSRAIDVMKSYVKERHDIVARNIGAMPESEYIFAVPSDCVDDITLVMAMAVSFEGRKSLLKTAKLASEGDIYYYSVELPYPIAPQSEVSFTVSLIITNQLYPYPEMLEIDQDQTVRIDSVYYPLTPYDTLEYNFGFLGVKEFEDVTQNEELPYALEKLVEDSKVYYSTSETIQGGAYTKMVASFIKNAPLKHVNYLKRDLWISHWSNALELEEYYELTNRGAQLKSGFNRAKWFNGRYALKQYFGLENLRFPIANKDIVQDSIYFTDKVGNVSTSQVFQDEIIFKPRFPLYGNWNYNFTLGWDYKLSDFVRSEGDEYILQINLLDGMYDASYDKVSLNVFLPEGAEYIDAALPFSAIEPKISTEHSYMDYNGGHVRLEFDFENLVDELKTFEIIVKYRYTTWAMLQKPLTCAKYILLALVSLYALKMVDLSIESKQKGTDEPSDEVEALEEDNASLEK